LPAAAAWAVLSAGRTLSRTFIVVCWQDVEHWECGCRWW
jgi:hypothetical protein